MKPYVRVAAAYLLFGILWIFITDTAVHVFTTSPTTVTFFQMAKGWFFVAISSLFLLAIGKRAFEDYTRKEEEKHAVFHKTVQSSHHILLNYLNQMQLVTLEAERCSEFNKEVLDLANESSKQAAAELAKLSEIETLTEEHIDSVMFGKFKPPAS